jgi:hypothetical protein
MTTAALGSGIELEYDTFGSPTDPALLLVMGFTAQMTVGDERFCGKLAAAGRFVIHGLDDTLIHPSGGRRTAELVPGSSLLEVADMGHDMPEPLWPLLVGAIHAHDEIAAGNAAMAVAS